MKRLILFLFLPFVLQSANIPNAIYVLLDAGQTSLSLHDLGAGTAPDLLVRTLPGTTRARVIIVPTMTIPSNFAGSTYSGCSAPCVVNVYRDWGEWNVWQEAVDISGNPFTPRQLLGPQTIPFAGLIAPTCIMPMEVIGQENYQAGCNFTLPAGTYNNRRIRYRINNPGYNMPETGHPGATTNRYDGKASVKINNGPWIDLNCSNVVQLDENRWYGTVPGCSIASATFTIMLSANVPDGTFVSGTNTIWWRVNGTEGNTSGYRILDWNIEDTTTITQLDQVDVTSNVGTMKAHAATTWTTGDYWFIYQAPGINIRFNGVRQVTVTDSTHATFTPCGGTVNTIISGFCTSPNGTYKPPTSLWPAISMTTQPVMYAVKEDLPAGTFAWDDPTLWTAPAGGNAATGATLWGTRNILFNPRLPYLNYTLTVSCADCHTKGLSDLKKFNFSNHSIQARTQFHGGTYQNGLDIAAAVRAVTVVTPGTVCRVWNPPYYPGKGLDAGAVDDWTCGAGIDAQLTYGENVYEYLSAYDWSAAAATGSNYINTRELPTVWQYPDWNHWLPPIHPADYFPQVSPSFFSSTWYTAYTNTLTDFSAGDCSAYGSWYVGSTDRINFYTGSGLSAFVTSAKVSTPQGNSQLIPGWPAFQKPSLYPIANIAITAVTVTKLWEVAHEKNIEGCLSQALTAVYGARPSGSYITRGIPSQLFFSHGDHKASVGGSPQGGLDNTFTSHSYLSNIWYIGLQGTLFEGNFRGAPDNPIDSGYTWGAGLSEVTSYANPTGVLNNHGRPAGYLDFIMALEGPQYGYDHLTTMSVGYFDLFNTFSFNAILGGSGGPQTYATAFMTSAQLTAHYSAIYAQFIPTVNALGSAIPTGASLPGTCSNGTWFNKSGGSAGWYLCGAGNAWSLIGSNADNIPLWQYYIANGGSGLSCDVNAFGAFAAPGPPYCNQFQLGIPLMQYFGVPSATIDAIQAFAQLIWPISAGANGHDFTRDRAAGCTQTANGNGDGSTWAQCTNIF